MINSKHEILNKYRVLMKEIQNGLGSLDFGHLVLFRL